MMKVINRLKRIIAGILTIVVFITAIPCVSVSATKLQDVNEIAELIWKTLYVTPRDAIELYQE